MSEHLISQASPDSFPSRGSLETGGDLITREDAEQLRLCVAQLGRIVATMQRRMDEMEKERAQRVTVSHAQALAMQKRMRYRAAAICEKYALSSPEDAAAFRKAMKAAVLSRFGVRDLHDLPLYALEDAERQIDGYADIGLVMERRRKHAAEP